MKWNEVYSSEEELVADMLKTKSDPKTVDYFQLVKGYVYVESFKRYYEKHGSLTDKQMTQLKRLAREVYINTHTGRMPSCLSH